MQIRAFLAAISTALLLALPGQSANARETLTIGVSQYPESFHTGIRSALAARYINGFGRRPIVVYNADWVLECLACEELPSLQNGLAKLTTLEDGSEAIAITFTIKGDKYWGDGTPVTVDDFIASWKIATHPASKYVSLDIIRRIVDIEKINDKTMVVTKNYVDYVYPLIDELKILPAHIELPIFEADPENYDRNTAFVTDPTNPGLWNGPYRMVDNTIGAQVVFERNEHWKGPSPAFDRIIIKTIEATLSLESALISGQVDMISGETGVRVDQGLSIRRRFPDRFQTIFQPTIAEVHLEPNLDTPQLADKRVRQALMYAINRQAMVDQVFGGEVAIADTFMPPFDPMFYDGGRKYRYDPERAEQLLDEAGWTREGDGVRRNADGVPLQFDFTTTAGIRVRELMQQVIQQGWREIGVETNTRNVLARVMFGDLLQKRQWSGVMLFTWIKSPERVPIYGMTTWMIPTEENNWSGQNMPGYSNPRVDELIPAMEKELDREKRKEMFKELQTIFAEDLPRLPLHWDANPFILPPWLEGVRPTGHQYPTSYWVEEWRVAE